MPFTVVSPRLDNLLILLLKYLLVFKSKEVFIPCV